LTLRALSLLQPDTPCVRDIDSPGSKPCEGESISLRQGASGQSSTHAADASSAKLTAVYRFVLNCSLINFVIIWITQWYESKSSRHNHHLYSP